MKNVFAVILSFVILMLSAVSCTDHDGLVFAGDSMEVLSTGHSMNTLELCNPFFFCHSGHSTFVQSDTFLVEYTSTPVMLISENTVFIDISLYAPVWHPPKA